MSSEKNQIELVAKLLWDRAPHDLLKAHNHPIDWGRVPESIKRAARRDAKAVIAALNAQEPSPHDEGNGESCDYCDALLNASGSCDNPDCKPSLLDKHNELLDKNIECCLALHESNAQLRKFEQANGIKPTDQEPNPSHDLIEKSKATLARARQESHCSQFTAGLLFEYLELCIRDLEERHSGVIVSRECAEDCRTLQKARAVTNSLFPESEETTEIINKAIKYAEEIEQALGVER